MRAPALFIASVSTLCLGGCIASTAVDIVTAPIAVGSKAVDLATTSQSEADEKRGRELRKREEKLGKLERRYEKQHSKCEDGDRRACDSATDTYAQIQLLLRSLPAEPAD